VGRRQALHLLDETGIDPKANWFIGEGADAPHLARSVPLKKGLDDAMIALEPYLHLIEPGGVGRRKMEMDILVPSQPAVVFRLVGIEIVQNHMDLATGMVGHQGGS
jgi:hypothetical protein